MWFPALPPQLERAADAAWASIRVRAALPEAGWTFTRLSLRDDAEIARLTCLAAHEGGARLVFTHQIRPHDPRGFADHFGRQVEAWRRFPHSAELTMPEPLCRDTETQSSLIAYVEGRPLSDAMRAASGDRPAQLALLARAGAWLDAFHRSKVEERRLFQPKYTVGYYKGLRDRIEAGTVTAPARALFLKGIRRIVALGPAFEGHQTVSAAQHGDFHMRNLIASAGCMAGIDISRSDPAPVGHDIAKILLDYTAVLRDPADIPPGQVVPKDAVEAFFQGYRLVGPDDPGLGLLLYARVLATLFTLPADEGARSEDHWRSLDRLVPIAERAFADTPPHA